VAARRTELARLDSTLAATDRALRAHVARTDVLAGAARRGVGGLVIVFLRTAGAAPQTLSRATLRLDDAVFPARLYYAAARDALAAGGADELHRGSVLAVPHEVTLTVVAGERTLSETVTVTPGSDGHARYVQFVLTATALEASSWLGGAAPGQ
jgi:hypothetical protein